MRRNMMLLPRARLFRGDLRVGNTPRLVAGEDLSKWKALVN